MSLDFVNTSKFLIFMGAAAMIIAGVVMKNGVSQYMAPGAEAKWATWVGSALFLGGWALIGYFVYQFGGSVPAIAAALIVASVMIMMYIKTWDTTPKWAIVAPIVFAGAWLALGWGVGRVRGSTLSYGLGIGAAVAVILAMLWLLPWQRDTKTHPAIVDGPGMPLFTLGFVALALVVA